MHRKSILKGKFFIKHKISDQWPVIRRSYQLSALSNQQKQKSNTIISRRGAENAEEEEKIGTRITTDSLDSKRENQSVFICENLCPISLRLCGLCVRPCFFVLSYLRVFVMEVALRSVISEFQKPNQNPSPRKHPSWMVPLTREFNGADENWKARKRAFPTGLTGSTRFLIFGFEIQNSW